MALATGKYGCHIGAGFSAMEIFVALYDIANITNPENEERDRIIVSRGHCGLGYYTILWKQGFVSESDLASFDHNGTSFYDHGHRNLKKSIEFSGGSLGLGLSYAVGTAMACKKLELHNRIYVLMGDGECDEGIVWESLMSIANFNLNNITIIVDRNKYQGDGPVDEVMKQFSLEEKFSSFGFDVETINGHSMEEVYNALIKPTNTFKVILADTIKANGISFLVNTKASHYSTLSEKRYQQAVDEINAAYNEL